MIPHALSTDANRRKFRAPVRGGKLPR